MEPIIDHIEITVKDMTVAAPFYDKLLPLLGFDLKTRSTAMLEDHELHVVEYLHPRLGFAINSPRSAFRSDAVNRRRPGALHHLAFRAQSRAEVDGLHRELTKIGATIVSPPRGVPGIRAAGLLRALLQGSGGHQVRDRPHAPRSRSRRSVATDRVALANRVVPVKNAGIAGLRGRC